MLRLCFRALQVKNDNHRWDVESGALFRHQAILGTLGMSLHMGRTFGFRENFGKQFFVENFRKDMFSVEHVLSRYSAGIQFLELD